MTYPEFIKSLTKEQRKCHDEALFEVMESDYRRYQETVALKRGLMLLLYALNFEPYPSVDELASAVRATVERLQETPAAGEAADVATGLPKSFGRASETMTGLPIIYEEPESTPQ